MADFFLSFATALFTISLSGIVCEIVLSVIRGEQHLDEFRVIFVAQGSALLGMIFVFMGMALR